MKAVGPNCLRHTELPGASPLFTDLLYDFGRVDRFYEYDPSRAQSLLRSAANVSFPDGRRAAITQILRRQNGDVPALDLLRQPGAVAVVTGQQAGLFGGPCYTVYKALTAVALAARLRAAGVSAVPVFWMATEDHDFAEVNHCWVFGERNSPVRLEIAGPAVPNVPVGGIPVGRAPVDELRAALAGFPYVDDVLAAVSESYAPGQTFGSAFRALLKRILQDGDLLFFDPMDPGARELAAPLMARAVENGTALVDAVLQRNRELQQAGYHQQVRVDPRNAFFFLLQDGQRLALRWDGGEYAAGARKLPPAELATRSDELSPNALLRPVMQDYLFPTAAYVGGPAELAYFAQNQVVYRALDVRLPLVVPRASATILDARAEDLLARHRLRLPDLFQSQDRVKELMAPRFVPAPLSTEIGETRLAVARLFERAALADARSLAKSRSKIEYQLAKVERRIACDAMESEGRVSRNVSEVCNLVYPCGHMQERFYAILPFLARCGLGLIGKLKNEIKAPGGTHQILSC
jgi:bacillithiol biosynthesis cysteine-adding enzyme BshC